MTELVALVPMRHRSERVSGKNYRDLAGRPLYEYILETLLEVHAISRIVVDTDSPAIRDGVRERFERVELLNRPQHLQGGEVPMNEVLLHDVQKIIAPRYLQTHSTNPLLTAETIDRAILAYADAFPEHDSLFSVTRRQVRLWDSSGRPINHDPGQLLNTQDLPPVFEENSCLYLFDREPFLESHNRIGSNPLLFEVPASEALDIDDVADFQLAESLLRARQQG